MSSATNDALLTKLLCSPDPATTPATGITTRLNSADVDAATGITTRLNSADVDAATFIRSIPIYRQVILEYEEYQWYSDENKRKFEEAYNASIVFYQNKLGFQAFHNLDEMVKFIPFDKAQRLLAQVAFEFQFYGEGPTIFIERPLNDKKQFRPHQEPPSGTKILPSNECHKLEAFRGRIRPDTLRVIIWIRALEFPPDDLWVFWDYRKNLAELWARYKDFYVLVWNWEGLI